VIKKASDIQKKRIFLFILRLHFLSLYGIKKKCIFNSNTLFAVLQLFDSNCLYKPTVEAK